MKECTMMFDSDKKFSLSDPSRNTFMEELIVYNLTTPTDAVHKTVVGIAAMVTTWSFSKSFHNGRHIRMPAHGFNTSRYMQSFYDNISRQEHLMTSTNIYTKVNNETSVSIDLDSLYSLINHPKYTYQILQNEKKNKV